MKSCRDEMFIETTRDIIAHSVGAQCMTCAYMVLWCSHGALIDCECGRYKHSAPPEFMHLVADLPSSE